MSLAFGASACTPTMYPTPIHVTVPGDYRAVYACVNVLAVSQELSTGHWAGTLIESQRLGMLTNANERIIVTPAGTNLAEVTIHTNMAHRLEYYPTKIKEKCRG